jgi:DNA-binding NarL/FixJ family response regulator
MNPVRAVIVDDERYACERLKKLLEPYSQIRVTGVFTNSIQALDYIAIHNPDLLFLDVELENNVSAFDMLDKIDDTLYKPSIIFVTAHTQYTIRAIKLEVFDYIMKPVDVDELEDTIDRYLQHKSLKPEGKNKQLKVLSDREMAVLNYVLEGKNSREIAELMYISINTVHTHRRNILKKTNTKSFMELLQFKNLQNG